MNVRLYKLSIGLLTAALLLVFLGYSYQWRRANTQAARARMLERHLWSTVDQLEKERVALDRAREKARHDREAALTELAVMRQQADINESRLRQRQALLNDETPRQTTPTRK